MKPSDEELSEQALDALFRSGRQDPSPDDLKRLESRLSPWLDAAPAPKAVSARGAVLKAALVVVALGILAPAAVVHFQSSSSGPQAATTGLMPVAPANPTSLHREEPAPNTGATVPVSSLPDAPLPLSPRTRPSAVVVPAVAAPSGAEPTASAESAEPSESEATYLRRARSTLANDPSTALQMLDAYPSRYPQGVLAQEREVMAIDSLARLGRTDEARARARAFLAQYPRSAHASRIASIVDGGTP